MSISGIGSNVIRDYSAVYGSKAAASYPRSGEAKEPVADKAVKTYREQDAVPVYAERVQQTDELAAQNSGTTFPISSVIAKYEKYAKAIDEHYAKVEDYQVFVKEGWDKEDERGLTIGYRNGSLYDIDTEYGYGPGQRGWLEDAGKERDQYWKNYRREREETLRREKAVPSAYEKWLDGQMAYTDEILSELGNRTYGKNGTLLSQPNLKAMQQLLDYAVSNGSIVPLTKEILHLPGREVMQGGIDVKA